MYIGRSYVGKNGDNTDSAKCEKWYNLIPVKAALNMMGKEVGTLRAPLTEMEDAHKEVLKKAMIDLGIL